MDGPAVGSTFLGLAWDAVGSQSIAAGLLGWRWCVEKRIQEWEDGMRRRELVGGAPPPYERRGLARRVSVHESERGEVSTQLEMIRQTEERALRKRERPSRYEAPRG